jgi:hypothetical protein
MVLSSISDLYFGNVYLPTTNLLAHCGLTCVISVIFSAITCTVTEVASDIVNDTIYILTAIGLTPGGSSTSHIYTQTIHIIERKENNTEKGKLGSAGSAKFWPNVVKAKRDEGFIL